MIPEPMRKREERETKQQYDSHLQKREERETKQV